MYSFRCCPHCKSDRIEFADHRRFECFDCGMVFFQNIAAAVAILIEKDGKLLFTVRNQEPKKGKLDLPGGFTDPDETAEEACSRELYEELSIAISPNDFTYFTSRPNHYEYMDFPYRTEDMIFIARLPDNFSIKIEEDEIQAVQWIKLSEIEVEKIAFDSLRSAVIAYIEYRNSTSFI